MFLNKKSRRKIRYALVYRFVQFLIFFAHTMPRTWWLTLCGFLGRIAYLVTTQTRALVIQHLTWVYGGDKSVAEITTLAKRVYEYFGKNAGEILRASKINSLPEMEKFTVSHGYEHYEAAHKAGKGVVFVSCHVGAFDLQVSVMALRGLKPHVIGTPLKDERLNQLLWRYRNQYGAVAVERGRETFKLIKVLKSGGSVAILIDQDTKVKSRFVDFFGRPAATPVGATLLALKTGAVVIPAYIHLHDDGKQHIHFLPPVDMVITGDEEVDMVYNTQVLTNFIEDVIRKHPEQWVWMHERWKTKPGEEIQ